MNPVSPGNPYQPGFGARKPLRERVRERGLRVGDLPMGFGTLLVLAETLPGEQQTWKFGVVWLVVGGLRKGFNNLGEFALRRGDKAADKVEIEKGQQQLANIDLYRDAYFPEDSLAAEDSRGMEETAVDQFREELARIEDYFPEPPENGPENGEEGPEKS